MTVPTLTNILRNQVVSAKTAYELQEYVKWLRSDNFAAPTLVLGAAALEGSAGTFIRSNATIQAFDTAAPTTITPDAVAAAGTAAYAARRDHVHAITTSSNPGAAAVILASDGNGRLQLAGLGIGAAPIAGAVILASAGYVGLGAAAGRLVFTDAATDAISVMAARLGIATTSPTADIDVVNDGAIATIMATSYATTPSNRAISQLRSARGSLATPADVVAGDFLGEVIGSGYSGAATSGAFRNTWCMRGFVDAGTVSATSLPTGVQIQTTPNGSVARTERVRITAGGNVGIGMAPTYPLDVTGNLRVSTGFGCNGTTPQTAYVSGGSAPAGGTGATAGAYDTAAHRDALITLVNNIRAALVANGIMS